MHLRNRWVCTPLAPVSGVGVFPLQRLNLVGPNTIEQHSMCLTIILADI
jgi:hypothetical protein